MILYVSHTPLHFHTIQQPQMGEWRGINSTRHPASRWLTAHWKVLRRMKRRLLFRSISSSGAPSTSLSRWDPLTQLIWRLHRRTVGTSGAEGVLDKTLLFASSRPLDEPLLYRRSSGAKARVLVCLSLDSNWASDRLTVSPLIPSVHPVLLSSAALILPISRCY
jgi:hypothetical protein